MNVKNQESLVYSILCGLKTPEQGPRRVRKYQEHTVD